MVLGRVPLPLPNLRHLLPIVGVEDRLVELQHLPNERLPLPHRAAPRHVKLPRPKVDCRQDVGWEARLAEGQEAGQGAVRRVVPAPPHQALQHPFKALDLLEVGEVGGVLAGAGGGTRHAPVGEEEQVTDYGLQKLLRADVVEGLVLDRYFLAGWNWSQGKEDLKKGQGQVTFDL